MTIEDYRKNLDVIADINLKDEQLPARFRIGAFCGLQLAMRLLRLAEMQEAERGEA